MVEAASTAFILARRDGSDRAGQRFRFRSRIHFSFNFSFCRFLTKWHGSRIERPTFEFVSPIDMAWHLGIKPPCAFCRRVNRLQLGHGGLIPSCHAISIGDTNSNVDPSSKILNSGAMSTPQFLTHSPTCTTLNRYSRTKVRGI